MTGPTMFRSLTVLLAALSAVVACGRVATAQDTIDAPPETGPDEQLVPVAGPSSDDAVVQGEGPADGARDEAGSADGNAGADTDGESGEEAAEAPDLTPREELVEAYESFRTMLGDGVLDEAESLAKRVVELSIEIYGPRSNDTAKALTNLAIVQHQTQQYDAAEQNFETAVDIIEENEDRLNAQLVNPLKGLGAAQLANGRPDLAADTYSRAIHVTHVNEGPHNAEQIGLLEALAEVSLRMGEIEEARDLQQLIFGLQMRHFDGREMEMVPMLMDRAKWQHRAGLIFDERATYRRVINIIEDEAGDEDLRLIDPLTRLGRSYFTPDLSGVSSYQPAAVTTGEIYFKRAARIAEDHPDSDWKTLASTKLALGDFYMHQGNEQRARTIYRDAWTLLSGDEERLAMRQRTLERPTTLRVGVLPEFAGEAAESPRRIRETGDLRRGEIRLSYKVSSRGRATDVRLLEARPEEFTDMLTDTQRELRGRLFRPVFVDGEAVTSDEQVFIHRFHYRQSDLDALRAAKDENEEENGDADAGIDEP